MKKHKKSYFQLRELLTPKEASIFFSDYHEKEIDEIGIFRLIQEGALALSINLLGYTKGLEILDSNPSPSNSSVKMKEEIDKDYFPFNSAKNRLFKLLGKEPYFANKVTSFYGVWDVLPTQLVRMKIQNSISRLSDGAKMSYVTAPDGIILKNTTGQVIGLVKRFKNRKQQPGLSEDNNPRNYRVNDEFPENSELLIRKSYLIALEGENSNRKTSDPRTEKAALHTIGILYDIVMGMYGEMEFSSKSQLCDFVNEKYNSVYGVKGRTLTEKIKEAKEALERELE